MPKRVESPSSINTFYQCPRKYYYHYILGLPTKESIATLAGKTIHAVLEDFFDIKVENLKPSNIEHELKQKLLNVFVLKWQDAIPELSKLNIDKREIQQYYQESLEMLGNFLDNFFAKITPLINSSTFAETFEKFKPTREIFIQSNELNVRGYIDAIHETNGEIYILDYKTSKKDLVSPEYRRQLAIYACLYMAKYEKIPHRVGILFLRHGTEQVIDVADELLNEGKIACEHIQKKTESSEMDDYQRNISPLCKWRNGECDYYRICFGQKNLEEF